MKAALALCLVAGAAAAQPAEQRMVSDAEAGAYAAVGRLNVAGDRHCTATLIAPSLVLTAAHCLYNARTGRRSEPGAMRFVAGQRRDAYVALREVAATATPPDYAPGAPSLARVARDIALLELAEPITADLAGALPVSAAPAAGPVAIVAYGRDRAYAASIREGCGVTEAGAGVVALDCAVTFGVSGAPVLATGPQGPEVVAVVSAMGEGPEGARTLAVPAADWIAPLSRALAAR